MQILAYNWRDRAHPAAGGAEVFTHEVLSRLADRDHEVTLFTSAFDGAERETTLDGVRIVRSGGRFTVYWWARRAYRQSFAGTYDVVLDEINTRPFMAPTFVDDAPVVALIHQLAREFWFYETPFPLSWLGYHWLEDRWLRSYTDVPTITVSDSTRRDLEDLGFRDLTVVPEGIDVAPLDDVPEKADRPTFLFVGRMTAAKRPEDVLRAFERVQERLHDAHLHVVGDGYLLDDLRSRAAGNGQVTFHGHLPGEEKLSLMKRSHVLLVPGVREGWGLVVTEANAMGTPAVGYDVPGLRDSIKDGETGRVCRPCPSALAEASYALFTGDLESYARRALVDAGRYDWAVTASAVENVLQRVGT